MIQAGSTILASDFVSTSSGATDSGKVPVLDSNGKIPSGFLRFGGDGSDGALTVSSGTTTINLGGAQVFVKNYTSISITGTGKVNFSNPHNNGTTIILKSKGNITLTSSQAPMLDASGMGVQTQSADGYGASIFKTNKGTNATAYNLPGNGGALPTLDLGNSVKNIIAGKYPQACPGASGGGGARAGGGGGASVANAGSGGSNGTNTGQTGSDGSGSAGGGVLILECGGAFNFTTSGGISVAGVAGVNATGTNTGGGGGGGGGVCIILYNTLTANSGTITKSGGTGGTATAGGGNGGAGGDGYSLVAQNTEYA